MITEVIRRSTLAVTVKLRCNRFDDQMSLLLLLYHILYVACYVDKQQGVEA